MDGKNSKSSFDLLKFRIISRFNFETTFLFTKTPHKMKCSGHPILKSDCGVVGSSIDILGFCKGFLKIVLGWI